MLKTVFLFICFGFGKAYILKSIVEWEMDINPSSLVYVICSNEDELSRRLEKLGFSKKEDNGDVIYSKIENGEDFKIKYAYETYKNRTYGSYSMIDVRVLHNSKEIGRLCARKRRGSIRGPDMIFT